MRVTHVSMITYTHKTSQSGLTQPPGLYYSSEVMHHGVETNTIEALGAAIQQSATYASLPGDAACMMHMYMAGITYLTYIYQGRLEPIN